VRRSAIAWFAASLLLMSGAAQGDTPRRVVSFNLCADQLVLALADPGQIVGLSPYAANPALSVMAEKARDYPRLDWQAESTVAFKPDLVLTGAWDRAITRRILDRLGYRVVTVEEIADIDAARRQIRDVAALLGHPERGERLVSDLDAARARLAATRDGAVRTAMIMERGGFAPGPNSLAFTLLREAGLQTPEGAPGGIGGFVSLERLLALKPDLIFIKDPPQEPNDQGSLRFDHPALRGAWPAERRIAFPTRYTLCGGPALVAAFDHLAGVMKRLAAGQR
jgi:iron complex transport system substrate-binding protein